MTATGSLVLPPAWRRRILRHARRDAPRECCGFLVGRAGRVLAAVPASNSAAGTTRYRIDPREHIALRRRLRADGAGAAIVGVYHSHPAGAAAPSETDIAESYYPEWTYVIVGLGGARASLRAFQLAGGQAREILIRPGR